MYAFAILYRYLWKSQNCGVTLPGPSNLHIWVKVNYFISKVISEGIFVTVWESWQLQTVSQGSLKKKWDQHSLSLVIQNLFLVGSSSNFEVHGGKEKQEKRDELMVRQSNNANGLLG